MFKLKILGANGLYPTENNPTSGYLIQTETENVLVDCGSGVLSSLIKVFPPENLTAIILTHLHFDHISDMGVLSYYLQSKKKNVKVFLPCDDSPLFYRIYNSDFFNCEQIFEHNVLNFNGLEISFTLTNHPVECYSVSAEYKGKTIFYSSDTNVSEKVLKEMKCADLAVLDSAFLSVDWTKNKPHLSAKLCGEYAEKAGVKRLILSHLNPLADKNALLCEAKEGFSNVCVAECKEYLV